MIHDHFLQSSIRRDFIEYLKQALHEDAVAIKDMLNNPRDTYEAFIEFVKAKLLRQSESFRNYIISM